jgi:aromatic ring-opening dioxygenase LigB subunit
MHLFLIYFFLFPVSQAIYVGTILLPHGDFAWDPEFCAPGTRERNVAEEISSMARRTARWLLDQNPDVVLLTTPHGLQLDYDYGIYHSDRGSGSVSIGQDLIPDDDSSNCNSRIKAPYDVSPADLKLANTSIGEDLLKFLKHMDNHHPVSAIYSPNEDTPVPLYWGEIIPLLILLEESQKAGLEGDPLPFRPLIWTFPHRRYTQSFEMVPELLRLGADIMTWIRQRPEHIAIVVSGDLSHTHLKNGPYGYSAASTLFDKAIESWIGHRRGPCQPEAEASLLDDTTHLQQRAMSCGFTGYVLWHGMMMCHNTDAPHFQSLLLANGNVTYYGMCCAFFEEIPPSTTITNKRRSSSMAQTV